MDAVVAGERIPSLLAALARVPDRRGRRGRRYTAAARLTFAVCAMLCGAQPVGDRAVGAGSGQRRGARGAGHHA
jgi:hypothetical protein